MKRNKCFRCIKGTFRKNRLKNVKIDVTIASTFFPVDVQKHDDVLKFVDFKSSECPRNSRVILG